MKTALLQRYYKIIITFSIIAVILTAVVLNSPDKIARITAHITNDMGALGNLIYDIGRDSIKHELNDIDNYRMFPQEYLESDYSNIPIPYESATVNDVMLLYSKVHDTYELNKYTTKSFDFENIIFYEALPLTKPANKTVFIIPGSGHSGARDVMGIDSKWGERYYHDNIGIKLVNNGYAVYTIELRGWGEREHDVGIACDNNYKYGKTVCSARVFEDTLCYTGIDVQVIRQNEITQILKWINGLEHTGIVIMSGLSEGGNHVYAQLQKNSPYMDGVIIETASETIPPEMRPYSRNADQKSCYKQERADFEPIDIMLSIANAGGIYSYDVITNTSKNLIEDVYRSHNSTNKLVYNVHLEHKYDLIPTLEFLDGVK